MRVLRFVRVLQQQQQQQQRQQPKRQCSGSSSQAASRSSSTSAAGSSVCVCVCACMNSPSPLSLLAGGAPLGKHEQREAVVAHGALDGGHLLGVPLVLRVSNEQGAVMCIVLCWRASWSAVLLSCWPAFVASAARSLRSPLPHKNKRPAPPASPLLSSPLLHTPKALFPPSHTTGSHPPPAAGALTRSCAGRRTSAAPRARRPSSRRPPRRRRSRGSWCRGGRRASRGCRTAVWVGLV